MARISPSGLNATDSTRPAADARTGWLSGVSAPAARHSWISPSPSPAASSCPCGANATALTNLAVTGPGTGTGLAASRWRVTGSHSSRSLLPTASIPPPGLNATLFTGSGQQHGRRQGPDPRRAVGITADQMPAAAQASEVTGCGWGSVAVSARVARFHTSTSSSLLPAAMDVPPGLNATAFTQSWPRSAAARQHRPARPGHVPQPDLVVLAPGRQQLDRPG